MKKAGYCSKTAIYSFHSINERKDFDLLFEESIPSFLDKFKRVIRPVLPYLAFIYCIKRFDIFHISFKGGILCNTPIRKFEAGLLKLAKCKIVCLPYGSDAYVYNEIADLSLRHALLTSYPETGKKSCSIKSDILYWSKNADAIVQGFIIDSMPRWDVLCGNFVTIDTEKWKPLRNPIENDGINGPVKISHTPNHRGCKGTEYLIEAVNKLKNEGLQIELVLMEGKKNDEVKSLLQNEVDIHCDQLIIPGYGLSAIEGMAVGLPVLSNLESDVYLQVFRRFSFLNNCPIISASPETIYRKLKTLITDPELRKQLSEDGRQYVESFHSFKAAQYLFESIYKRIWYGEDIDLINLYHPLKNTRE